MLNNELLLVGIVDELNLRASSYEIGELQQIRRRIKGLSRLPTRKIFDDRTVFEDYAFHVGGRKELQFNIGFDSIDDHRYLRHGVAFSLQLSQSLPSIEPLLPKIAKFNEFLRAYPEEFSEFRMWRWKDGIRSQDQSVAPISPDDVEPGVFLMLGRRQQSGGFDIDQILRDFDRLLPVYRHVEGSKKFPEITPSGGKFKFSPGGRRGVSSTVVSIREATLDRQLRHNMIQDALGNQLAEEFGFDAVRMEQPTGKGTKIDVALKTSDGFWFYEIKTASTARMCIREALAQLLEYSYWPGSQNADRLIVVGEAKFERQAQAYLRMIREQFKIPIYYEQISLDA